MSDLDMLQDEAIAFTQELIRIDTTNHGNGASAGERTAAEYAAGKLREVGLEPTLYESEPGRTSLAVRIPGADRERGGLVLHGHLDVVPADASEWSVSPFSGEQRDGMIWGRGAVDMKDMDGMILAVVRHIVRTGQRPPRDLVVAFFADEEDGGTLGSHWMVENHPEVFAGCTEAVGEVGGYSVHVPSDGGGTRRVYLLQSAEKGLHWLRLVATGRPGHGSVPHDDSAIATLAAAIGRITAHEWEPDHRESVAGLLEGLSEITGEDLVSLPSDALDQRLDELLGSARPFVAGARRDSANVTTVRGGYKTNVVPGRAEATVDCRFLPGHEERVRAALEELTGERIELVTEKFGAALEAPLTAPLVDAMKDAIRAEDPDAVFLPYCLSGGTDNKALARIGIAGYGFAPLMLPPDLAFTALFHGIDERVPVDSVRFGARALHRFLMSS